MNWNKPKNIWYWLALLSPGALSLACTAFGYLCLPGENAVGPAFLGVLAVLPMCPVIAYFLARRTGGIGKVLGFTVLFTLVLLVVNLSIAIGGCVAMPSKMDFK